MGIPSIKRQAELIGIYSSTAYYQAHPGKAAELERIRRIDNYI